MTLAAFGLAAAVIFLGAVIQGVVGLGMNLLAAPLLALVDPALVPVPLLILAFVLSFLALRRESGYADWRGMPFAVLGRVPGAAVGTAAVALLPRRSFAVLVGVFVLACVLASVWTWQPRPTRPALLAAGFLGGVGGTAASIGGPPVAVLYQHEEGPRVRATMACYMLFGGAVSLAGLGIGGQIGPSELTTSLGLVPFMALGFLLSTPLRGRVDAGWTRPAVLGLSAASSVLLIVRSLL
ncbi:sulfite exporter TauE/SafE family protein [Salinifilum aidingensis]